MEVWCVVRSEAQWGIGAYAQVTATKCGAALFQVDMRSYSAELDSVFSPWAGFIVDRVLLQKIVFLSENCH